jgi:hypothetical protein
MYAAMSSPLEREDATDLRGADAVPRSEATTFSSCACCLSAQGSNLFVREASRRRPGVAGRVARDSATFRSSIGIVLGSGSKEPASRVLARRVVAGVADAHGLGDRSVVECPPEAMRQAACVSAVSLWCSAAGPWPATIRTCRLVHLRPVALHPVHVSGRYQ